MIMLLFLLFLLLTLHHPITSDFLLRIILILITNHMPIHQALFPLLAAYYGVFLRSRRGGPVDLGVAAFDD